MKGWDKKAEMVFKEIEGRAASVDGSEIGGGEVQSGKYDAWEDRVVVTIPASKNVEGNDQLRKEVTGKLYYFLRG